ncbi:hypothetical protein DH2020_012931 [Rehmannia glutinosa]|uniref:NB-ARC domain-containing protein n=1 Tax=Rehmannia glutinosa TaxID=99300 RepID=A0ABR0X0V8_REHGL
MAYAAVVSLKQTIQRLLNSSHVSIVPCSREILESVYDEAQSLPYVLRRSPDRSSWQRLDALDGQIRETTCDLEDALESHVSNLFTLSQSESHHPSSISLDLQELKQDIDSFSQTVKRLKEDYMKELSNPLSEEEDNNDVVSSRIDFCENESKMIGLSDEISKFKHLLVDSSNGVQVKCVPLFGMAGIGKTTLAKEIFKDSLIQSHFDRRAFITIGPRYQLKEILQAILAQLNPGVDIIMPMEEDERLSGLKRMMYESLKGKRYLIVFDDLWHGDTWGGLRRLFPNHKNGSRFLVTTRLKRVAESVTSFSSTNKMRFLNNEESWCLLREKVFDEMLCHPQLENAGKKIAQNCEGLPLTIITVGDLLSKAEKTPEYWNKVVEKENSIFIAAYDRISKVIFPSYKYLPQYLKACFLYMGVFPENYEIPLSKLSMLWSAEGFFEPYQPDYIKFSTLVCVKELVSTSLVITPKQSSTSGVKTCRLHSVFWHLCNKEAQNNKFFHVLNSCADRSEQNIENQHRLCIRKNILFGIKDMNNSSASISTVRSLILCNDPPDHYPVTINFDRLRLLRVFDALTISLYEFPIEVLKLVHLRYLALTYYNGNIPPSISNLWNLAFMIVRLNTKSSEAPSYMPMEIWDMKELKYLQIMGADLPSPCDDALLPNLLTLLDVSVHSCTKGVLERLPNLMKLGVQLELTPDVVEPLSFFEDISHLNKLESLNCVVVNPKLRSEVVATPPRLSIFSSGLHKLSLSGFGFPWKDTRVIASLPCLRVLKLRSYAFRGPKWETNDEGFRWVEFLLIEDSDLVHWTVGGRIFPCLMHLSLKQCCKLQEIPGAFGKSLRTIEVVDCNSSVVTFAKQMEKESHVINVNVHSL